MLIANCYGPKLAGGRSHPGLVRPTAQDSVKNSMEKRKTTLLAKRATANEVAQPWMRPATAARVPAWAGAARPI